MNILTIILLFFIGTLITIVLAFLIIFWKDIQAFFFPQNWVIVTMLELDDNVRTWLQKKSLNLTFEYNGYEYKLYNKERKSIRVLGVDGKENEVVTKGTAVYRRGRLATFFYIEGNLEPLDYRNLKMTERSYIKKLITKEDVKNLFTEEKSNFEKVFDTIKPFLIIGIIILVVFIFIKMTGKPPEVAVQ